MATLGSGAAFAVANNLLGVRMDPFMSFNFLVEIEGLIVAGFSEVSGLQVETVVETYREGGLNDYEHKLLGPTRYPSNLILKHGLTAIGTLWDWYQDVTQGKIQRRNGTIYLLNNQQVPAIFWDFYQAYPVKWSGPDFRAENATVAIETVELVHHGIIKPKESSVLSIVQGAASAAGLSF